MALTRKRQRPKWLQDFTVIVIPKAEQNTWRLNVTGNKLIAGLAGITLMMLFAIFSVFFIAGQRERLTELAQLKETNSQQELLIAQLSEELDQMNLEQADLIAKQEKIRSIIGISSIEQVVSDEIHGGQGGGSDWEIELEAAGENGAKLSAQRTDDQISRNLAWQKNKDEVDQLLMMLESNEAYYRAMPNQWPAEGSVSSEYGLRKSPFGGSKVSLHDGLDIANQPGTPIIAAADGKIIYSAYMPVYGLTVMIEHGNGLITKYGHCSELIAKVGQWVEKGEQIALMGNTGRSTGPHVHFTIFLNGQTVDPRKYLP